MAWSTHELAELAGTTVNTVRYYHRLGLLDEPDRKYNGYKQYRTRHLVRLLRIRRLVDLCVPLAQLDAVWAGGESTVDVLRAVDAELAASIVRLHQVRSSIDAVVREGAPADVPVGFESAGSRLTETDRALLHIYARFYDAEAMANLRCIADAEKDDAAILEFDMLPVDAGETTRRDLAERLAFTYANQFLAYPWLLKPEAHLLEDNPLAAQTIREAVLELYNAAQIDVADRAKALALERVRSECAA